MTRAAGRARAALERVLQDIDDELLPVERVLGAVGLDGLAVLLRADWLRLVSVERGLGPVLWSEAPDEAMARIAREPDARAGALVKMTPTGANALRALESGQRSAFTPGDLDDVVMRVEAVLNADSA